MDPTKKSFVERWSDIINSVEKTTIPIDLVKRIQINDETTIDIEGMKNQGMSLDSIEAIFYSTLLKEDVGEVEYYVDIDAVAKIVQRQTDKLLDLG